jgi:hypothetical protein
MTVELKVEMRPASRQMSRHVRPEEFLRYAIGRRKWERLSDSQHGLTGLVDPDSGEFVYVDSAELDRFRLLPQ